MLRRRWLGVLGAAAALGLALAGPSHAQPLVPGGAHEGLDAGSGVGDVPPGSGVITGRVVHPEDPARTAGLDLALYALQPDGSPGLREGNTDASGAFRFENVSTDPSVVYLIGARFAGIPFGRRIVFADGAETADLEIPVADPVADPSGIRVLETELRLEWVGSRVAVQETHRLHNAGDRVVFVPPDARAAADVRPAFETALPEDAEGFFPGSTLFDDSLVRQDERVLHWGPVYPGDSEVRFQYWLGTEEPAEAGESTLLSWQGSLPAGARRVVVLVPAEGIEARFDGLEDGGDVDLDGRTYTRLEGGPWAPGRRLAGSIRLPPASSDPSLVRIQRMDAWLELDGAALTVSQEVQLAVDGDNRVVSHAGAPLLELPLPEDAEFLGISQDARTLGAAPAPGGGIALSGPLPPGESRLALRYRVPTSTEADGEGGARLDLRFTAPVELLNVLVADTGLVVEDERLHRRRPFRSGTRTYLHREGFQIEPGETISLRLTPLRHEGLSRDAAVVLVALVALGAVGWVFRPLGGRAEEDDAAKAGSAAELARERASVYTSIRDLDHDFETGKIGEDDYHTMREELRAQAVDLLREERRQQAGSPGEGKADRATGARPDAAPAPPAPAEANPDAGAACPRCGETARAGWRFCASCGAALPGAGSTEASASGVAD